MPRLTKTALSDRGWIDALIREFLGKPDATKANPRFLTASPMQLNVFARVEAAEATPAFREGMERATIRSGERTDEHEPQGTDPRTTAGLAVMRLRPA